LGHTRHATIYFSDAVGYSDLTERLGDSAAAGIIDRLLKLQSELIAQDGRGRVLQYAGDSVFAVFESPSQAISCALEVQETINALQREEAQLDIPKVRIGLHVGEVLLRDGDWLQIVSRHVNRAHRVMEAAEGGQTLASKAVVDAGRDFVNTASGQIEFVEYGEAYLKGVGPTELVDIVDRRFRQPHRPAILNDAEAAFKAKLQQAGFDNPRRIGEGHFGVVYVATDRKTAAQVALKVLNPAWVLHPGARQALQTECSRLEKSRVPGIVRIIADRTSDNPPFLVMEFIEGRPIDIALAGATRTRLAEAFALVCRSLHEAHSKQIVHGDVKPGNILIRSADGQPVLLDFGFAALSGTTEAVRGRTGSSGAPEYSSPEQIQGQPATPASDIYSVGVLLYKVLTGQEPFRGDCAHEVSNGHISVDPQLPATITPQVDDGLQRICLKALEKDPNNRYHTAAQMADDLDTVAGGRIVRTRPTYYDNLLFHRARTHTANLDRWLGEGLLSPEERHRLVASYEPLMRRGIPAVMEGRRIRVWQTFVYLGIWCVLHGCTLWLLQFDPGPALKLALGTIPLAVATGLAAVLARLEQYRLLFVSLIAAVLALPLAVIVWLDVLGLAAAVQDPERQILRADFIPFAIAHPSTNLQLAIAWGMTAAGAAATLWWTRTITHSALAAVNLVLFWTAALSLVDLRFWIENERFATVALAFVPLLLLSLAIAIVLLHRPKRAEQATPWLYLTAVLLVVLPLALASYGIDQWVTEPRTRQVQSQIDDLSAAIRRERSTELVAMADQLGDRLYRDTQSLDALSRLLTAGTAAMIVAAGVVGRRLLAHRARIATFGVTTAGILVVLASLYRTGLSYPDGWPSCPIFGADVPLPHVTMPIASLVIVALAARVQLLSFLMLGLFGLASSIYLLAFGYFTQSRAWPTAVIVGGALCFIVSLAVELRRSHGHALDDLPNRRRL